MRQESPSAAGAATESMPLAADRPEGLRRRRRFLVNRSYQLRVTSMTVMLTLLLLVSLNVTLYVSSTRGTAEIVRVAPEFEPFLKAQDRTMIGLIVLGSIVFLVGVFVVGILESHRTAGVVVNLRNRLDEVERGDYRTELRIRRHDNFQELMPSFNRAVRSLRDRAWNDVESLEGLAGRIEGLDAGPAGNEIATELRRIAADKRRRLE